MSARVLAIIAFSSACSGSGTRKLVQGLLEIIQESVPLGGGNQQMLVRPVYCCGPPAAQETISVTSNIEVMSSIDRCFVPIFG